MSADAPPPIPHSEPERRLSKRVVAPAVLVIFVSIAALVGWATIWPVAPCDNPSCARTRFTVSLEIDAVRSIPPIDFDVDTPEGAMSLQSILAGGGIDIRPGLDELELPYSAESGALDRADLYQFVSRWRNRRAPPGVDAQLYALLTAGLVSDKGEPLFGIMFDIADREGFAVAPRTTARFFEANEPQTIRTLQLRTFIHELLHALNRHHEDAAQLHGDRLTLEAPTRCIADTRKQQWSLRESPLLALSPSTIRFFQTASRHNVLPGKESSSFDSGRASPTECEDARRGTAVAYDENRWELMVRQLKTLFAIRTAIAAEEAVDADASVQAPVEITLQVQPAPYPLGYPIAVRMIVRNASDMALPIKGRLNPGYGMVQIEYRRANDDDWNTLQPLSWFEPTTDAEAMLAPGERADETIPIYFGNDGWTFSSPGDYVIRARLQTGEAAVDVLSREQSLRVERLQSEDDRASLQPLLNRRGELDVEVGKLISFGGRIGGSADITPIQVAADLYGHTAIGSAMRLTLLSQRLRRPIDPVTGERAAPDFSDAEQLLEDTCTDSGVEALTFDVLSRGAASLPAGFDTRIVKPAVAWDGATAKGESIPTYSDPTLSAWGPSLHFCINESAMRRTVTNAIPDLARRLARERPKRIVIVGHGDQTGNCRLNDELALQRAQSVRTALVNLGVSRRSLEAVSLGERRPVDFAATAAAQNLNRRVEILVESISHDTQEVQGRIMPQCPAR